MILKNRGCDGEGWGGEVPAVPQSELSCPRGRSAAWGRAIPHWGRRDFLPKVGSPAPQRDFPSPRVPGPNSGPGGKKTRPWLLEVGGASLKGSGGSGWRAADGGVGRAR